MRRRIRLKGLISRTNPDGSNSYISPEMALHKKLQRGTINEEELHIYVELTHIEGKQMPRILQQKLTIKVFGRLIEVTKEQYNAYCRNY